jgi:hypothetical protein
MLRKYAGTTARHMSDRDSRETVENDTFTSNSIFHSANQPRIIRMYMLYVKIIIGLEGEMPV